MLKKIIPDLLKLAVSVLLVWFFLKNIDLQDAFDKAMNLKPFYLFMSCLMFFILVLINTVRWIIIMKKYDIHLDKMKAFKIFYIGLFFNLVLPSSIGGDGIRIWELKKLGIKLSDSASNVLLDRVTALIGLSLLVLLFQPLFFMNIKSMEAEIVLLLLIMAGFAGVLVLLFFNRLPEKLLEIKPFNMLATFADDAKKVFTDTKVCFYVIVLAMIGHSCFSLMVYFLGQGLDIEISALECLILIPPVILMTVLPISIAGWGVREGSMVSILGFIGISSQASVLLSVMSGIVTTIVSLPGGLIWLLSRNKEKRG